VTTNLPIPDRVTKKQTCHGCRWWLRQGRLQRHVGGRRSGADPQRLLAMIRSRPCHAVVLLPRWKHSRPAKLVASTRATEPWTPAPPVRRRRASSG